MNTSNQLTHQEHQVLALVAKGWRNAKIASELVISTRTVETHLYRIFDKLDVSSRTEAALYTLKMNSFRKPEVSRTSDDTAGDKNYSGEVG